MNPSSSDSRAQSISKFLAATDWNGARLAPLSGDASTRRYIRLFKNGSSALLMDAPAESGKRSLPARRNRGRAHEARLQCRRASRRSGQPPVRGFRGDTAVSRLRAPRVYAANFDEGLLVLEDLGDDLFARAIEKGAAPQPMYEAAIDVLAALHARPAPGVLGLNGTRVPLLAYDRLAYKAEVDLAIDWLYPLVHGQALSADARAEWDSLWASALNAIGASKLVIVLRDYHAENLFWLPDAGGLSRVGLIDFQDGLQGSAAYDLISLIEDARRDVEPELAEAMLKRYVAAARARDPKFDETAFRAEAALLGAQRNAKILGIFARLWKRDGKPGYLKLLPRVWGYMERDLSNEALMDLRRWFDRHFPKSMRMAPEPR